MRPPAPPRAEDFRQRSDQTLRNDAESAWSESALTLVTGAVFRTSRSTRRTVPVIATGLALVRISNVVENVAVLNRAA